MCKPGSGQSRTVSPALTFPLADMQRLWALHSPPVADVAMPGWCSCTSDVHPKGWGQSHLASCSFNFCPLVLSKMLSEAGELPQMFTETGFSL